jgi:GNAT superfamily N-acetyltransferase
MDPFPEARIPIRLARPNEAGVLTELAIRSKASWGYSDAFIAACRAELTITQATLTAWTVWVALVDEAIGGMIALNLQADDHTAELEDFFVEPRLHGRGVGAALMATLLDTCRARGVRIVGLDADPFAESIYHRFGFETVGRSPSGSIQGRLLPRMELRLR